MRPKQQGFDSLWHQIKPGRALAIARSKCGWTQEDLADKIDCKETKSVGNWEADRNAPSLKYWLRLRDEFDRAGLDWSDLEIRPLAICYGRQTQDPDPRKEHDGPVEPETQGQTIGPRWWRYAAIPVVATILVLLAKGLTKPTAFGVACEVDAHLPDRVLLIDCTGKRHVVNLPNQRGHLSVPPVSAAAFRADLAEEPGEEILVARHDSERAQDSNGNLVIFCIGARGNILWSHALDESPLFGGVERSALEWTLKRMGEEDLDGDGRSELLVIANHKYFPSLFFVLNSQGERVFEFANGGHIENWLLLSNETHSLVLDQLNGAYPMLTSTRGKGPALLLAVLFQDRPASGLVYIAPTCASGRGPSLATKFACDRLPLLDKAVYMVFPPSTSARITYSLKHNHPSNLEFDPHSREILFTTLELKDGDENRGIIRTLSLGLRQVGAEGTSAFDGDYRRLCEQHPELPKLKSEAFARDLAPEASSPVSVSSLDTAAR